MAWEYPDWYLITLCGECHKTVHKINNPTDVYEEVGARIRSSVVSLLGLMGKEPNNG